MFATLIGPSGKVLGVEPSPPSFSLLWRSLSTVENIVLVNKGLSDRAGELTFYIPSWLDRASFTAIPNAQAVSVSVVRGDELSQIYGQPQFVKIDTEGHELQVFEGLRSTLARDDRPIIVFEALGAEETRASVSALSKATSNAYDIRRIRLDGTLTKYDDAGTSDLLALPSWASSRLQS